MEKMTLRLANPKDASALAELSKRAFHTDIICGGQGEGGPPGYDSPVWQARMMKRSKYYKFLLGERIIGGAIVIQKGIDQYCIGRIFIDPDQHRKGLGVEAMNLLFAQYPQAKKWTLETPPWNERTKAFYLKLGFTIVGETKEDIFFEKING